MDNCLAMGSERRSDRSKGSVWEELYGDENDRCRILFALNTVGAGRSTTMLWETKPVSAFCCCLLTYVVVKHLENTNSYLLRLFPLSTTYPARTSLCRASTMDLRAGNCRHTP